MTKFIHLFSAALLQSCIFSGLLWTPISQTTKIDTKLGLKKNTSLMATTPTFRHPRFIPIICSNCSIFLNPQKKPGSGLGGVKEDEEDCETKFCSEGDTPCCSGTWCSDGRCTECEFEDKPCQTQSDCEQCPETTCRDGQCKYPKATCLQEGSTCPQNLECCQGLLCHERECAKSACRKFGKSCSANKPCCENLRCYVSSGETGRCATIPKGCSKNGDSCRSECDCCNTFATCDRYSGNCRWSAVAKPSCRFRRNDDPVYPIPLVTNRW